MEDLQNWKYKELQKSAKAAGIKANSPKAELVKALTAFNNGNEVETQKKPDDLKIMSTKNGNYPGPDVQDNGNEGENEDETKKQPKGARSKKGKNPGPDAEDDIYPPFLLISSTGPAAHHHNKSGYFGLYCKTKEMILGRSVYKQENDPKFGDEDPGYKLISDMGVWVIMGSYEEELRATEPSELPTSVKWEYADEKSSKWHDDDPALTVIGLDEKPSCDCEVIISEDKDDMSQDEGEGWRTEMAGLYRANGSYRRGRPVLQHSEGQYILSVGKGGWRVEKSDDRDDWEGYYIGTAPSQCPDEPRATKDTGYYRRPCGSMGISLTCNKCVNNINIANIKIKKLERIIKTMEVEIEELIMEVDIEELRSAPSTD